MQAVETSFKQILIKIVNLDSLHAKWLNTLSYLENCGARKIAACEHPTFVKEEMLKHAAEEFRHAHSLKKQIVKVSSETLEDYDPSLMLGGWASLHYLFALDVKTSRHLQKEVGLKKASVKEIAYLLVTYAIELRAHQIYPLYEEVLRQAKSKVTVKSIFLEEKEHLKEMEEGLKSVPSNQIYVKQICLFESQLFKKWMDALLQHF